MIAQDSVNALLIIVSGMLIFAEIMHSDMNIVNLITR